MYVGAAGGHFEHSELNDPRACVLREMEEELGLRESDVENLTMRYVTLRLKNGEIRQNYYFFAELKDQRELHSTEGNLRWVTWQELETLEMPVSARHMMDHYLRVGRFDNQLYGGATREPGTEFVPLLEFGS